MTNSLDAVRLYIPLMKETNMTWEEGILAACHEYSLLHSMDGYDAKDIGDLAKNKPEIRSQWGRYMAQKRKYEALAGQDDEAKDNALAELKQQLG